MRKLKLQVQMTLDGFIAGPNGEMDWITFNWDDELKRYVKELTDPVDCIVLGRRLAQGFIPHWASNPAGEDPEGIAKMNNATKVVFSKTLRVQNGPTPIWQKATLRMKSHSLKNKPVKTSSYTGVPLSYRLSSKKD